MENGNIKHLSYFKVENFKCFDSLELKNIAQFNLILGDNNVGKTSVLEALLFDEKPFNFLSNFLKILFIRSEIKMPVNNYNYVDFFLNSKNELNSISYDFQFKGKTEDNIKLSIISTNNIQQDQIDNLIHNTLISINDLPNRIISFETASKQKYYTEDFTLHRNKDNEMYMPFVKSGLVYFDDLVTFYSKNIAQNVSLKRELIENLHILSEDIYDITIDTTTVPDNPILLVLFKNDQKPIPLFMMGDGTVRLVRLILEIIMSKNNRLMIDEIDNGMHFSRMKKVWEVVLKVAAKNNTQLFITTHDAECLRAFKEVLESDGLKDLQQDVASYSLIKTKQGETNAVRFNFEEFEHAVDYSLNIRG